MSQDQWIALLLKIGLVAGVISIILWTAVYSRLAEWWKHPVGRTLVVEAGLIGALFVPQILSLFFSLNRFDSLIAAWADVALIGLVTPVMLWRTIVFLRIGPSPARKSSDPDNAATPSSRDWGEHGTV
jgi:hypothetical protein